MKDFLPLLSLKQTATINAFLLDKSCTKLKNKKGKGITQSSTIPHFWTNEHLFTSLFSKQNFFLHWDFLKSKVDGLVTKLCPTLMIPWTVAHQASMSMGFPRQEHWSGLAFLSPGIFTTQGSNLGFLHCLSLPTEPPGKLRWLSWYWWFLTKLLQKFKISLWLVAFYVKTWFSTWHRKLSS